VNLGNQGLFLSARNRGHDFDARMAQKNLEQLQARVA
jgi:hypothetical protein